MLMTYLPCLPKQTCKCLFQNPDQPVMRLAQVLNCSFSSEHCHCRVPERKIIKNFQGEVPASNNINYANCTLNIKA